MRAPKAQKRAARASVGSQSRLLRVSARAYRVQCERIATCARARSTTCVKSGFAMVLHLQVLLGWYAQPVARHQSSFPADVKPASRCTSERTTLEPQFQRVR